MKRKLLGLVLVCLMVLGLGFVITANAEGEEPETPTYACVVKVNSTIEHGNVLVDIEEGNVGDVVTITAEPSVLYVIDSVYANGTQILTNEDGLYQFALVEGENTVSAKFVLNNEALEAISEIIESTKDEGFDSLFTVKNLVLLISVIVEILGIGGLLVVVSKFKNVKEATTQEVTTANQNAYNVTLNNVYKSMEDTKEVAKTLARCMVLAQEGTPEARLAIIDEITKLQNTSEDLANEVKNVINDGLEKMKEMQNAKIKAIEELKEVNDNITNKNESNDNNIGRY